MKLGAIVSALVLGFGTLTLTPVALAKDARHEAQHGHIVKVHDRGERHAYRRGYRDAKRHAYWRERIRRHYKHHHRHDHRKRHHDRNRHHHHHGKPSFDIVLKF